jgi:peroxiredoxin
VKGDIVENFSLKNQYEADFDLYKNLDKKVLLVFYPKDDTIVCTKQLSNYEQNLIQFEKNNIRVVGVNKDETESHRSFCNKLKLSFPVLSDITGEVSKNFKALNLLGRNKRKLVLINTDRTILFEKVVFSLFYLKSSQLLKEVK